MSRYLVIEVADDLSAQMASHLIEGLEFAGQRVGTKLKVRALDPEEAISAIDVVIRCNTSPSTNFDHRADCDVACDCGAPEQGAPVSVHARDCATRVGHCGCVPTSWEIAADALRAALEHGVTRP